MSKHIDSEQKLERALTQALEGLPLRRAPSTLELRVVDELERPCRASLVACQFHALAGSAARGVSSLFVSLSLRRRFWEASLPLREIAPSTKPRLWFSPGCNPSWRSCHRQAEWRTLLVRVIPPLWLYGGWPSNRAVRGLIRAGCCGLSHAVSSALIGR